MKIIYCIHSIYNPGGMERVLLNKVEYLAKDNNYSIKIVTTNQNNRLPFYNFPENVSILDLGINYSSNDNGNVFKNIVSYLRKKKKHKKLLTEFLLKEKADIVISLYPSESSFITKIKDGSKKILELHYCKFFRLQYNRKGILGLIDKLRTKQDEKIVKQFDKFIVLSNEDRGYWGDIPNIDVIPNAALNVSDKISNVEAKRVIAVGRLDYQKGFDRLLQAWAIVQLSGRYTDWHLDIFGQGEWKDKLELMIKNLKIKNTAKLCKPTNNIFEEYANSSLLVMSSNYEGFPMVMIEAMASGLPVVSFDFKCGPKDIIKDGKNGLIVKNGDVNALANAMMQIMGDSALRKEMSINATNIVGDYSEEKIMNKWINLFNDIIDK